MEKEFRWTRGSSVACRRVKDAFACPSPYGRNCEPGSRFVPRSRYRLNERDLELLRDLQTFFGCGWIRESKTDRTFKYEARAVADLLDPIIPHFERHPLRGGKARSFVAFADVCRMIEQGDHLRRDGLRSIIDVAYEMNLGKRRLARDDLLRALMR